MTDEMHVSAVRIPGSPDDRKYEVTVRLAVYGDNVAEAVRAVVDGLSELV